MQYSNHITLFYQEQDDVYNIDKEYTLSSIVVHIGSGVNQGHYISLVKMGKEWVLFDDEKAETVPECTLEGCFP
jgi:ubiquitin carboxyl-terminal hydrolase 12/46